jgi:hypothetical protein
LLQTQSRRQTRWPAADNDGLDRGFSAKAGIPFASKAYKEDDTFLTPAILGFRMEIDSFVQIGFWQRKRIDSLPKT